MSRSMLRKHPQLERSQKTETFNHNHTIKTRQRILFCSDFHLQVFGLFPFVQFLRTPLQSSYLSCTETRKHTSTRPKINWLELAVSLWFQTCGCCTIDMKRRSFMWGQCGMIITEQGGGLDIIRAKARHASSSESGGAGCGATQAINSLVEVKLMPFQKGEGTRKLKKVTSVLGQCEVTQV